jgi:cysteine desulfurase
MSDPIYLDHHATTPLDPQVLETMLPFYKDKFGNASSIDHSYGNDALAAVNTAREKIGGVIHAESEEIIFTSGATEADNLALFGVAQQHKDKGSHIITCVTEHKAILDSCKKLESMGFDISYLPVDVNGCIDLKELEDLITPKTILISIMAANNEIGTIAPLKEIGKLAHEKGVLFHTDAAQAFGHIPLDVKDMNIDLMSISAHKIYGPKGIGALFIKRSIKLQPITYGGGHERGLRSGTLNVPGIVGLAKAAEIAHKEMNQTSNKLQMLSEKLYKGIAAKVKVEKNGDTQHKLTHNLNLFFEGIDAKALINEVKDDVALSAGSACTSEDVNPSHVIIALGYDEDRAFSSIRFGLGRFTTEKDIDKVVNVIAQAATKLKNL